MITIVDNYDSFTYNLVHYFEEITNRKPIVMMNDKIDWEILDQSSHIVLSPGPGLPKLSGDLMKVIGTYYSSARILGVCLGMQAIAEYFGGQLINMQEVKHGIQSKIEITSHTKLFKNLPDTIEVGRYHSWAVDTNNLPSELVITSVDSIGVPMSMEHKVLPIHAVQFHPESIMTKYGKQILRNWIDDV